MRHFAGCSAAVVVAMGLAAPSQAQVLYAFADSFTDGAQPRSSVIMDASGDLYGTTYYGGSGGVGTVYRLQPPSGTGKVWTESVIWSFGSNTSDGQIPSGDLLMDKSGALYGETQTGGAFGSGTVYKLTPPQSAGSGWSETILIAFDGTGGRSPSAGLIADASGNLYGTTGVGGGNVFKLIPPAAGQTQWTEQVLYSFVLNTADGASPEGRLFMDPRGNLFGTTAYGGAAGPGGAGVGTVFELSPPLAGQTSWTEQVLYRFDGTTSGGAPMAGLTPGPRGGLYGTTSNGGIHNDGTVYQLRVPGVGGLAGGFSVLHDFLGSPDGAEPLSSVTFSGGGNLYGTTAFGGNCYQQGLNCLGTIFKLTPPSVAGGAWAESIVYAPVTASQYGDQPGGALVVGAGGALYGTFSGGGRRGFGTVFKLGPALQ